MEQPDLGIGPADLERLGQTVTHVIHCAASVAFDGNRYLVVWAQAGDIYGRFVDASGTLSGTPATGDAGTHRPSP